MKDDTIIKLCLVSSNFIAAVEKLRYSMRRLAISSNYPAPGTYLHLSPNILTRIFTFMTALAAAAVVAAPSSATHQKQTTPPPALKTAGSEATISESDAIAIIIGESGGEPYAGHVAVAAVLRRCGSTRGFYCLNNPIVAKASPKTVAKARRAWCESLFDDPSNGVTHFENVRAFGTPAWAAGRNPCAVIGSHTFWKLK